MFPSIQTKRTKDPIKLITIACPALPVSECTYQPAFQLINYLTYRSQSVHIHVINNKTFRGVNSSRCVPLLIHNETANQQRIETDRQ